VPPEVIGPNGKLCDDVCAQVGTSSRFAGIIENFRRCLHRHVIVLADRGKLLPHESRIAFLIGLSVDSHVQVGRQFYPAVNRTSPPMRLSKAICAGDRGSEAGCRV
jgi:hypothetical protein